MFYTLPDGTTIDLSTAAGIQAGHDYINGLVNELSNYATNTAPYVSGSGGFTPSSVYASLKSYLVAYDFTPGNYVSTGDPHDGRRLILDGCTTIANMLATSTAQTYTPPVPPPSAGATGGSPITGPLPPTYNTGGAGQISPLMIAVGIGVLYLFSRK